MANIVMSGRRFRIQELIFPDTPIEPPEFSPLGEFVGPFPSWNILNLNDGDITIALQSAIDTAGVTTSRNIHIINAETGTYTMSQVTAYHKSGLRISFDSPDTTHITYVGVAGGKMFFFDGCDYCTPLSRVHLIGNGAAIAIDQSSTLISPFDTGNKYCDLYLEDFTYGIRGGYPILGGGHGFAEVTINRVKTLNVDFPVSVGNDNALDVRIRDCYFENYIFGVTNAFGSGNFNAYKVILKNGIVPFKIQATESFSIRECSSSGAEAFLYAGTNYNSCPIICENNNIMNMVISEAYHSAVYFIVNQGWCTITGDKIRNEVGGRLLFQGGDKTLIRNTTSNLSNWIDIYGVNTPIVFNHTVDPLTDLELPDFVGWQPKSIRPVIEVTYPSTVAQIQAKYDEAALLNGQKPILHFQEGYYVINTDLNEIVTDVQTIGDGHGGGGYGTVFARTNNNTAPIFKADARKKARFEAFTVHGGNKATQGILLTHADQAGGQIIGEQVELRRCKDTFVYANGLDYTNLILLNTCIQYEGLGVAIKSKGGTLRNAGTGSPTSKLIILGGSGRTEGSGSIQFGVENGGHIVGKDYWGETNDINVKFVKQVNSKGDISLSGFRINSPVAQVGGMTPGAPLDLTIPDLSLNTHNGKLVLLSSNVDSRVDITGTITNTKFLALNSVFRENPWINNLNGADARGFYNNHFYGLSGNSCYIMENESEPDESFMNTMLADLDSVGIPTLIETANNITNVELSQVWITNCDNGLEATA